MAFSDNKIKKSLHPKKRKGKWREIPVCLVFFGGGGDNYVIVKIIRKECFFLMKLFNETGVEHKCFLCVSGRSNSTPDTEQSHTEQSHTKI